MNTTSSSSLNTYTSLLGSTSFNYVYPDEYIPNPTTSVYSTGYITRYFVQKVNDISVIIEVSMDSYNDVQPIMYNKVSFDWLISGPQRNTYAANGVMQSMGVYETNVNRINVANENMIGIKDKIINPLQFYKL